MKEWEKEKKKIDRGNSARNNSFVTLLSDTMEGDVNIVDIVVKIYECIVNGCKRDMRVYVLLNCICSLNLPSSFIVFFNLLGLLRYESFSAGILRNVLHKEKKGEDAATFVDILHLTILLLLGLN